MAMEEVRRFQPQNSGMHNFIADLPRLQGMYVALHCATLYTLLAFEASIKNQRT